MATLSLAAVAALSGCGGGDGSSLRLDGSARIPDDEGVATRADADGIVLDDDRRYSVSDELLVFSTTTLEPGALVQREGQYVQVGLDGDEVVWLAWVASVVPVDDGPRVYYAGRFEEVLDGRWLFEDGSTFDAGALDPPQRGDEVQIIIDPEAREAVAVRPVDR